MGEGSSADMRICDIVQFHSPISGGVKRYIRDKCRFYESRPEVEHLVLVPGQKTETTLLGRSRITSIASPLLPGSRSYRLLFREGKMLRLLREFKPDILEVGDPYVTGWIGRNLGRKLGLPVVSFYHSDYPRGWDRTLHRFLSPRFAGTIDRAIIRYLVSLYRGMDALVVATSQFERLWTEHHLQNVVRIPLGVDGQVFAPRDSANTCRREWNLPPEARIALFVGRMAREKNIRFLIEVGAELRRRIPDFHLVLIGDGELRPYLERMESSTGWLRWIQYVDNTEVLARAYSAAQVFVHAGLAETFGLSALEAQACGTPVVAARNSGLDETVLAACDSALAPALSVSDFVPLMQARLEGMASFATREYRHEVTTRLFPKNRTFEELDLLYRHLMAGRPLPVPALEDRGRDSQENIAFPS